MLSRCSPGGGYFAVRKSLNVRISPGVVSIG